jgi:hypothetical protein
MRKLFVFVALAAAFLVADVASAGKLGPQCLQSKKEYDASLGPKAWAEGIRSDGRTACGYGAYQSVKRDLETQKARAVMLCQSYGGRDCRVIFSSEGP